MGRDESQCGEAEGYDQGQLAVQVVDEWSDSGRTSGDCVPDEVDSAETLWWSAKLRHQEAKVLPTTKATNKQAIRCIYHVFARSWEADENHVANCCACKDNVEN